MPVQVKRLNGERPAHVQLRDVERRIERKQKSLDGKRKEKGDLEIEILELRRKADVA